MAGQEQDPGATPEALGEPRNVGASWSAEEERRLHEGFATLADIPFRSRAEAKAAAFEYLEVLYNWVRLHSGLGYRTPADARASMEGIAMRAAA